MNTLTRAFRFFKRRRSPVTVATLSGKAAGLHAPRRGTVLVLILGALALISVVTLVYMTVGRGDRRGSAVVVEKAQVKETVQRIGEYIANQIALDALDTFVSGEETPATGSPIPVLVREAWDFPWVDSYRESIQPRGATSAQAQHKFSVTGGYSDAFVLASGNPAIDPRVASDPWLAPLMPTNLIPPASISIGNDDPTRFHDWWSISNFAPDGRFVNLWNLAPKVNGKRESGFDALAVNSLGNNWQPRAPQYGPSGSVVSEMSYGLTLVDFNTNASFPANVPQPMLRGGNADPNVPANWTLWQHSAFRLAHVDPVWGPGDAEYISYQWVDTDGDGFVDARWFELVDASNRDNPISMLPKDDRFRWFVAARAIDLSGLVNVNTATDFRKPPRQVTGTGSTPTQGTPLGLYGPSDIDLLRLLRMNDVYDIYGTTGGYNGLQQGIGADNYGGYDRASARIIGETAYNAIRRSLRLEAESVADPLLDLRTQNGGLTAPLTGDERAQYYLNRAGPSEAGYFVGNGKSFRVTTKFGMADLLELLATHGVNDPNTTSRLEQAADGRYNAASGAPGGANSPFRLLGPLRSAKSASSELGTMDDAENNSQGNGTADADAMRRVQVDVRREITPINASRPLRAGIVNSASANKLASADLAVDAVEAAQEAGRTLPAPPWATVNRDPNMLFRAYADALLPYSWRTGSWSQYASSPNNPQYLRLRTLSYGYNPELALRMAAHLTANFGDMYDKDDEPSVFTLLIDESKRSQIQSNTNAYPWWTLAGSTAAMHPGRLDLNSDPALTPRLAKTGDRETTASPAINVFGIEAQPFITEVVSFCIYCDAPNQIGGDADYGGEPPPGPYLNRITIDGTFPPGPGAGPDFLGQVLAFQLTNPFNTVVRLSGSNYSTNFQSIPDTDYTDFYLEYNKNLFKFAKDDASGPQSIVLQPGETRTFYVLSNPIGDLQLRWKNAWGGIGTIPPDAVERFIDNQLAIAPIAGITYGAAGTDLTSNGDRVKPIRLRHMNARSGASVAPAAINLFGGSDLKAKQNVYLWRVPRQGVVGGAGSGTRFRHILADRLHDPGVSGVGNQATLDRRIPTGSNQIRNTAAGPEPSPVGATTAEAEDNTGFTIALWGSVKRLDNPQNVPLGALPAYCLEAKWSGGALKNKAETDRAKPDSLQKTDFDNDNADATTQGLITKTIIPIAGPPPDPVNNPGNWPGVLVQANGTYATMTVAAHLKRYGPHLMPVNGNSVAYTSLYPQVSLDNNEFEATLAGGTTRISALRIADMLLPMALGPMYDPGATPPQTLPNGESVPPDQCMTLSEAMALSLNYSNPPATNDPFSLYYRVGDRPTSATAAPTAISMGSVDRGNIALDRFAPFEDITNVSATTPPVFEPPDATGGGGNDAGRWPGIPLGLNIFNMFRTMDPQFGTLTRGTAGLINLNTTTLPVMRLIPLLSPTTDTSSLPAPNNTQAEWTTWKTLAGASGTRPLTDTDSDIAAAVQSYRDKLRVFNRFAQADRCDDTNMNPFAYYGADGRYTTTLISGLRETPGISSVGELMAVINRSPTQRIQANDTIDQLASDNQRSGVLGTNSVLYKTTPTATNKVIDDIQDDYTEKLLLAQGALNSVSVRGDIYAVWFVVHGYQRSDTENLGPNDPLVPTIAKRFVMVVDRSNITNAGQKPRILLFTEVPM